MTKFIKTKKTAKAMLGIAVSVILMLVLLGTSAIAVEPILIGMSTHMTGPNAWQGENSKMGADIAVKEINENGGVLGRPLKIVLLDDREKVDTMISVAQKLSSDPNIVAVLAPCRSFGILATHTIYQKAGMPFLAGAQSSKLNFSNTKNPYFFRTRAVDTLDGGSLAMVAINVLKGERIGILFDNSDFGTGMADASVAMVGKLGKKVVAREGYNTGDKDFIGQLLKIKKNKCDVLISIGNPAEGAIIARQVKEEAGLDIPCVGSVSYMEGTLFSMVDPKYIVGWYGTTENFLDNPDKAFQNYIQKIKAQYGPKYLTALTESCMLYDEVYIIAKAIKQAGEVSREAIRNALEKMEFKGVRMKMVFDKEHNGYHGLFAIKNVLKNGKVVNEYVTSVYEPGYGPEK